MFYPTGLFINNKFVPSSSNKTFSIYSPTDGSLVESNIHAASQDNVDAAVSAARAAFKTWKNVPSAKRAALMLKLADLIEVNIEILAKFETDAMGCPVTSSRMVVAWCAEQIRYYAGLAGSIHGSTIPEDGSGHAKFVYYEPLGVCAAIAPWNGSMLSFAWKVAPAIAAGNTIVYKASEKSPLGPLLAGKLCVEAGFPPGVINVVSGAGDVGALLASHMDVNKISFTGSTNTGRKIQVAAAQSNLKICTLELGGKSAAIVFEDAELDNAVLQATLSILGNSGQICNAGSRILIHEGIAESFIPRLKEKFAQFAQGFADPHLESTMFGPVADQGQFDRIMGFIGQVKKEDILFGGDRGHDNGCFVQPTLIMNPSTDHPVYQQEIFGPVAVVKTFKTDEEAVELANAHSYGLGATFYTKDVSRAMRLIPQLNAGTVGVNAAYFPQKDMPFGGWKESGYGRECGIEGMKAYMQTKSVQIKL